ncbi:cytochrome c oxidase assembly protein [Domibacillus robiginosus]|uniref:cytochrome c oxidase assembly protein n=1 Tax=Domibacillus robiginosus TaxID=1071054 RepID=UPI00067D9B21|nr:cytochrome c oxidase assembly protein [Domibacillus robiginosus]
MHNEHHMQMTLSASPWLAVPFIIVLSLYVWAAFRSRRRKAWPASRTALWIAGVLCSLAAVMGPVAQKAHTDFVAHMTVHLLLGMLAPLFLALAAPMTLFLRTLPVQQARLLSRLLQSRPLLFITNPAAALVLNIGGLWLLYTTSLYTLMQENVLAHVFVHLHVFLAGYVFTASILCIDPAPFRRRFRFRAAVLLLALAGHSILSKFLYAHPPAGVSSIQAEAGSMLMYYGGDAVDLVLVIFLCSQWFHAARPRKAARPTTTLS